MASNTLLQALKQLLNLVKDISRIGSYPIRLLISSMVRIFLYLPLHAYAQIHPLTYSCFTNLSPCAEAGALVQLESLSISISNNSIKGEVTEHTIANIISQWTSIPLGQLLSAEQDRLVGLESELRERVKGQSRAIKSVARAIRRARSGLRDMNRPVASFLFCGPTGMRTTSDYV
jgi:ATP-dependent Clp protease ATP-binding subunit ClpA